MKYTKPTIDLVSFAFNENFCGGCDTVTTQTIVDLLQWFQYDVSEQALANYFAADEACAQCTESFIAYCKFTSASNGGNIVKLLNS